MRAAGAQHVLAVHENIRADWIKRVNNSFVLLKVNKQAVEARSYDEKQRSGQLNQDAVSNALAHLLRT